MSTKTVKAQRTEFTMNNEDYRMDRYKSRTVLVFKKINGVYDFVSAKQIIRLKLNEINPIYISMSNYFFNNLTKLSAIEYETLSSISRIILKIFPVTFPHSSSKDP